MPFLLLFTSIWPAFPRFHCTPNKSVHPQALTECSPLDFRRSSRSFSIATGSEGGVPALRSVGGGGWCFVCAAGRNWKVKWKYRLWKEPEYRKHWSCLYAQRLVLFCVSDERVSYTADLPGRNVTEILAENWSVKKKRKKEKEDFFFLGGGGGGRGPLLPPKKKEVFKSESELNRCTDLPFYFGHLAGRTQAEFPYHFGSGLLILRKVNCGLCRRHHSLSLTINGTLIGFSSYCGCPSWPGNAKKHHWLSSRCGPSSVSAAVCQSVGCSAGASSCHFLAALTRLLSLCSAQLFSETAISGVHQCFAGEVSPHLLDDIVVTSGSGWRSRRSLRRGRPAGAGTEGRAEPPRRRRLSGLPGLIPVKPLHDTSVSLTHWLVDVTWSGREGSGRHCRSRAWDSRPWKGRLVSATLPSVCVCQWCQATEFDSVKAAGQSPPSQSAALSVSPYQVMLL